MMWRSLQHLSPPQDALLSSGWKAPWLYLNWFSVMCCPIAWLAPSMSIGWICHQNLLCDSPNKMCHAATSIHGSKGHFQWYSKEMAHFLCRHWLPLQVVTSIVFQIQTLLDAVVIAVIWVAWQSCNRFTVKSTYWPRTLKGITKLCTHAGLQAFQAFTPRFLWNKWICASMWCDFFAFPQQRPNFLCNVQPFIGDLAVMECWKSDSSSLSQSLSLSCERSNGTQNCLDWSFTFQITFTFVSDIRTLLTQFASECSCCILNEGSNFCVLRCWRFMCLAWTWSWSEDTREGKMTSPVVVAIKLLVCPRNRHHTGSLACRNPLFANTN